jgi:hypothetical protein
MARRHATHPSDTDPDGRYDPTKDPNSHLYIDRGDTSDTGQQVHQNAENTADQQEDGDGFIEQIINIFTRQGRVDTAYNQELNQQASELADGVNTRQPPTMMTSNYLANPHPELQRMVTEGVDPDAVGEMGDTWIEAGNAMTRFQTGVASAINNSEADWSGQAGNSARTFMAGVGNWVGNAGQSAQLAGTQTNIQASALAEARRAMPEPVDFDVAAANRDLQSTTNPIELVSKYNTYMSQYNAQQDAHQQAARVVSTFDSSLAGASTMPAFAAPPQMNGGDGTVNPRKGQIDGLGTDPGVNPNGGGTGGINGTGTGPGGPGGGNPNIPTLPGGGPGGRPGTGGNGGPGGGNGGVPGLPGGGSTGGGGTDPSSGGGFPGGGPGGPGGGAGGPGGFPLPGGSGAGGPGGAGGANGNFPGGGALPIGGLGGGVPGSDFERGGRFPGGGRFGPGGFGTGGGFGSGSGSGSGFGGGSGSGSGYGSGSGGAGGAGGSGSSGVGGRGGVGPGGGHGRHGPRRPRSGRGRRGAPAAVVPGRG